MVYSNNDQKSIPAIKIAVVCKPLKENVEALKYNMNPMMGKYIPHITSGCVLVKYSRY
jgi:hypothetical protein